MKTSTCGWSRTLDQNQYCSVVLNSSTVRLQI
jgi:hypothetical protein